MTFLLAVLAGILGAVLGYGATVLGAGLVATALQLRDFEGSGGILVVFVFGPAGGLAGMIGGIVLVLRARAPGARAGAVVMRSAAAVVVGLGLLALAPVAWLELFPPETLGLGNRAPVLRFEFRFPAGPALAAGGARPRVTLETDRNDVDARLADAPQADEAGRPVLAGSVDLYFRAASRVLVLRRDGMPDLVYRLRLRLRADAHGAAAWTDWRRADDGVRPGGTDAGPELRTRVAGWDRPVPAAGNRPRRRTLTGHRRAAAVARFSRSGRRRSAVADRTEDSR